MKGSGIITFLTLQVLGILFTHPGEAAPTGEQPMVKLGVVQIGGPELPPLYFLNKPTASGGSAKPSYESLPVSSEYSGATVQIPYAPSLKLFTSTIDEKGHPIMTPYLEIPAKGAGDRLLLVFHLDSKGNPTHTFLDHSTKVHPPGSVRYANLSAEQITITVGGSRLAVGPGDNVTAFPGKQENGRFVFSQSVGTSSSQSSQEASYHLRLRSPNQRLTIIFTAIPVPVENGEKNSSAFSKTNLQPVIFRFYDNVSLDSPISSISDANFSHAAWKEPSQLPRPPAKY